MEGKLIAMILGVALVLTLATVVTIGSPISQVKAQSTKPPISVVGNPHGFSTGPPIPSCNADFNQGPPNDPLKGCKFTP
jgi:hypothetical protein